MKQFAFYRFWNNESIGIYFSLDERFFYRLREETKNSIWSILEYV